MKIEVSNGELVDKVSILSIKLENIKDKNKLVNIKKEFDLLLKEMQTLKINEESENFRALQSVNRELWEIEDKIRIKEANQQFDDEFIQLARSVYFKNDARFEIKSKINALTNSILAEEKEYVKYK